MENNEKKELEKKIIGDEEKKPENVRVILVPRYMTSEELKEVGIIPSATVEAEYGEKVIEGEQITLAHHTDKYKNNPSPCNTLDIPVLADNNTIVVSHLDLDTLGGIAALLGRKKEDAKFWEAAEFIDLNGPHNLFQIGEDSREKYEAYQAYNVNNRIPRFEGNTDITDIVLKHLEIIDRVIDRDETLISNGKEWSNTTKEKIEQCLVFENSNVRAFNSPEGIFCSAAYYSEKQGKVIPATVTLNGKFKSVSLAMADGGKEFSAKEMVQELWGKEAGGHPGIAGSPRGKEMTEEDMKLLMQKVNEKYNAKNLENDENINR